MIDYQDEDIFAQLQILSMANSQINIVEARNVLNGIVKKCRNFPEAASYIKTFANIRKLSEDILNEADSFFLEPDTSLLEFTEEELKELYGFFKGNRLVYAGRYVLPIKDTNGDVAGFTGYDGTVKPKYLDSKNYGYKAGHGMLYGMEHMKKYYKDGYVVVPEGPMCALRLRSYGINALSTLGSYLSPYQIVILKRFGVKCFMVPDNDETGEKYKKTIKYKLPYATILQCTKTKDIDDTCKLFGTAIIEEINQFIKNPFCVTKYISR